MFLSLSSVVFAVVDLVSVNHGHYSCDPKHFFINGIYCIIHFVCCHFSSVLVFRRARIPKKLKWAVFKFSVVLMLLVTDLTLEIFLYWIEEDYIFFRGFIIDYLLDFVFVVTVMAMLHIPRSKCCNKVSNRTPLLANSRIQCSYQSFISVGSSQHS